MRVKSAGIAAQPLSFTLNGQPTSVEVDPEHSLLTVLREQCDCISPKNGCEPQASCGCCTVLVDGRPKLACAMKAAAATDREVKTLEGLPQEIRQELADCFVRSGGLQCGFCIPGFAMRAVSLLDQNPSPTRDQIAQAFRPHLCRCTGYTKIVDAVEMMARFRSDPSRDREGAVGTRSAQDTAHRAVAHNGDATAPDQSGRVGTRLDRYRGAQFTLGDFRYVDDIKVEGSLYAAMRFSDHPRALVKSIDASAALALDGVERVITAQDVPGDRHVGLIISDWPILVAVGEETRCVGDILAIVVARDQHLARKAAEKIAVEYVVREPVTDPEDALKPSAPKIHPKGNLLSRSAFQRGDLDRAFAESAHVVENTYTTQRIEHMYLEPEACIAIPERHEGTKARRHEAIRAATLDSALRCPGQAVRERSESIRTPNASEGPTGSDDATKLQDAEDPCGPGLSPLTCVRVLSQGQGVFDDRRQIASVLGWPQERVGVELVSNGGAFGGKEDMSIQAQTALAAVLTARPVKCTLTREESFRLHPKRHPIRMRVKVGCDADGRITAVHARLIGDKGAYASVGAKVLERAAGHAIGPYRCANVDIESLAVYTNNPPCGAMRGFGANQAAFAIERSLDALAGKVGIDGWEIRWRNVLEQGDRFCTGQRLDKPFGLKQTLLAVRDAYRGAKYAGIACGIKNVGIGNGLPEWGKAVMKVESPARITIRTGFTEMGQGYFTICVQTACEETGLPPHVFVPMTDTSVDVNCGQTTASRATVLGGLAIMDAARKLREDLEKARSHEATEPRRDLSRGEGARPSDQNPDRKGGAPSDQSRDREGAVPSDQSRDRKGADAHDATTTAHRAVAHGAGSLRDALAQLVGREYVGFHETQPTNKPGDSVENPRTHLTYGFATQVVILDDDGAIRKVIAAHDVGRVMNPTLLEGQIEGSIHMGLGYALTEDFPCKDGRPTNMTIKSLGVLRAHQMPEIECIFIEEPDPETAYGARGVGEIGLVPTAPAVAGALEAFDGVHRTSLPMKDSPTARLVAKPRRR